MSRILYKYLDIKGGKRMLGIPESKCIFRRKFMYPTLQFTNASQMNDPFDCHPKLIDYSNVPEEEYKNHSDGYRDFLVKRGETKALNLRNNTWLCSLSKVNDSLLMWTHYCYNHKGICIGLDIDKIYENLPRMGVGCTIMEPLKLDVQYQDIIQRPEYYKGQADPFYYQLVTKAKEWEYEREVRLLIVQPNPSLAMLTPEQAKHGHSGDWRTIHHYLRLKGECLAEVYFGVSIDPKEREKIIERMAKLNPEAKLYQMKVDEDAFRLKAEEI